MSFAKMKFFIATILLAACAAVQGRSAQVDPMVSMVDHGMGVDSRIIDGTPAKKGQLPWQAYLFIRKPSGWGFCGGSLISETIILTAAHCLYGVINIDVHLGGVNLYSDMEYNQTSYEFKVHEKYNPQTFENDVALIRLPVAPKLSPGIQIIPLARRSQGDLVGKTVRVSGFGKTVSNDYSNYLQFTDMTVITHAQCISHFLYVFPSTLCAIGHPINSACRGDSGGPIVQYDLNAVLVGVVSFGDSRGCVWGYPDAYARVSSFLDWINWNTGIPIRD